MKTEMLIQEALGKIDPWYVDSAQFEEGEEGKELHIYLVLLLLSSFSPSLDLFIHIFVAPQSRSYGTGLSETP